MSELEVGSPIGTIAEARSFEATVPIAVLWRQHRGLIESIAAVGLTAGCGLIGGVVLARALGPVARGQLAAVVLWATTGIALGDLGVGFAGSYFAAKRPERIGALWSFALSTGYGWGSALALIGAVLLARVPTAPHWFIVAGSMTAIPFGLAAGYQSYLLVGLGKLAWHNIVKFVAAAIYMVAVVAIALTSRHSILQYVIAFASSQVAAAVLSTALLRRLARPTHIDTATAVDVIKFGAKTEVSTLAAQTTLRLDQLLLSLLLPPGALGLYVVAAALASVPGPVFSGSALYTMSRVAELNDRRSAALRAARYSAAAVMAVAVPVGVMVVTAPWLISHLFGARFAEAVWPARILLIASLFQGVNAVLGNSLRSVGRPGAPAVAEISGAIVTVFLLIAFLTKYGIMAAAVTSLVAYCVVAGIQAAALTIVIRGKR
jgi:O-antigen/teichoic acid export membrane protein